MHSLGLDSPTGMCGLADNHLCHLSAVAKTARPQDESSPNHARVCPDAGEPLV